MTTIPISNLVKITPTTLGTGGGVNHLTGLIISKNINNDSRKVSEFKSADEVGAAIGYNSVEYQMALVYFSGTQTTLISPSRLLIAGYGKNYNEVGLNADYLNAIAGSNDFTGFTTTWIPGIDERQAVAKWVSSNKLYWYVSWDNDVKALTPNTPDSFGGWLQANKLDGTTAIYATTPLAASLALGWMASTNFDIANSRTSLAARNNEYVIPDVTDAATSSALLTNGYNFYGSYGGIGTQNNFFEPGSVSGQFAWADSYIYQIWMTRNFQIALNNLISNRGHIPFNATGDSIVAAALQDVINRAIQFGVIQPGVTLSSSQRQRINGIANSESVASTLQTRGWYLLPNVQIATPLQRSKRGPIYPIFFYTDGGNVQTIDMTTVEVQ